MFDYIIMVNGTRYYLEWTDTGPRFTYERSRAARFGNRWTAGQVAKKLTRWGYSITIEKHWY